MKKYIGTKQIEAEPMTMGEAYERGLLQVGRVPDAEYAKRMGYHVKYADGYESWSPAEPFEEAYKLADTSLDRMQIEAEEVNGRYVKLAAFIDSGKMDEVVNDMYNKCLLEMQCCTMFDYIRLLDTRIQRMQGSDGAKVIKMNFGMAIMALKAGFPIRRSGWIWFYFFCTVFKSLGCYGLVKVFHDICLFFKNMIGRIQYGLYLLFQFCCI